MPAASTPPREPLPRTGLLRDEIRAVIHAEPELDDVPIEVVFQRLLEVRPRVARALLPWLRVRPAGFALRDVIDELQTRDRLPAPGFADTVLGLGLRRIWPAVIETRGRHPVPADIESFAHDAGIGDDLRLPWPDLARRAIGALQTELLPDITLRQALHLERTADWAESVVLVLAAVATARRRPLVWPVVLDEPDVLADERRALLARLAPRRAGRLGNGWLLHNVRFSKDVLQIEVENRRSVAIVELHARSGDVVSARDDDSSAAALAWLFDVVNEPRADDLQLLRDMLAPRHDAVLAALDAFLAPTPEKPERFVWELQKSSRLVCRRQRPKANGKGWVKGTDVSVDALLRDTSPHITEQDRRAAAHLAGHWPDGTAALRALAGHPLLFDGDGRPVVVEDAAVTVALADDAGGDVRVTFAIGGRAISANSARDAWVVDVEDTPGALRYRVAAVDAKTAALARAVGNDVVLPAAVRSKVEALADRATAGARLALPPSLSGELRPGEARLVVRLSLADPLRLSARVAVVAGEGAGFAVPGDGPDVAPALKDGARVRYSRDLGKEVDDAAALVERLADGVRLNDGDDRFELVADDDDALQLFARAQGSGHEVVWRDQRRLQLTASATPAALKVRLSSARQWLGLDGEANVDGDSVSLAALLAAVRHQRRYLRLSGDRFAAVSDELREALRGVAALTNDDAAADGGVVEVSFAVAPALDDLSAAGVEFAEGAVWQQMRERLERARAVVDVPPAGLTGELRPYQRDGLLFLRRLAAFGTGGVLADDMGLGKTVQAIGLLLDRQDEGAAVVVAPTSLVFNWLRELERFAPSLRAHVYGDANDRARLLAALGKRDVLIVTYGLVDDAFKGASFATAIFDEAQAIKNADTQRARACRDLDATMKIAMSGTPLENHLGELWSLFRVVCPGLLGSAEQFRKRFLLPIERDRSVQHRRQLGQTLRPFLLRRTKQEVLTELPPLTEQLVDVAASADGAAIYEALRREILDDLDDGSAVDDRRFRVLAGLTRLRLCCCHPVLVEPSYTGSSAKLDAAVATLENVRAAGHKALVFSQFTKFLDLVEPALRKAGLRILRLDGSTPEAERRKRVDAFQRGEADVFLLSLKAGGAGLNLTAADVVVHLDPWWNPAVEAQAIARAHRMGRAEPVTAIRLVIRSTIEEAILKLHDEKRELIDGVLAGVGGGGGALGLDDIADLLRATAAP